MRFFIIIFSLVFFFFSCKKSDEPTPVQARTTDTTTTPVDRPTYDTIYPKSYYPIYPGSFWKYKVNDTSEETLSSNPTYQKHCYLIDVYEGNTYSDTVYVPFLNGEPVYGYDHLLLQPPLLWYFRIPFLSETVGDYFHGSYQDTRVFQSKIDMIWVEEKTKKGADSVITTKRQIVTGIGSPSPIETLYYTEYTKDIGITKYCILNGGTLDTTYKKVLIDHFINR